MKTSISAAGRSTGSQGPASAQPPAIASMARDAANDEAESPDAEDPVNPLWMITFALGILMGVMALFVATG